MRRTGFKPRELPRLAPEDVEAKHDARQERMAGLLNVVLRQVAPTVIADEVLISVPKEEVVRSEPYRRLVASLPCINCGIEGYSQHAHENEDKGKGLKLDDRRAMPLCCPRPGIEGCHVPFDQYRLLPGGREAHHEQGRQWSSQTRNHLRQAGLWPPRLPLLALDIEADPDG